MDMIHRFGDAMMTGIVNSQRSLHQASLSGGSSNKFVIHCFYPFFFLHIVKLS